MHGSLLQFRRVEGRRLIDELELLSTFQRVGFDNSTFHEVLKNHNPCSQIIFRRSDRNVINAGFEGELIDLERVQERCQPILYKKDTA